MTPKPTLTLTIRGTRREAEQAAKLHRVPIAVTSEHQTCVRATTTPRHGNRVASWYSEPRLCIPGTLAHWGPTMQPFTVARRYVGPLLAVASPRVNILPATSATDARTLARKMFGRHWRITSVT